MSHSGYSLHLECMQVDPHDPTKDKYLECLMLSQNTFQKSIISAQKYSLISPGLDPHLNTHTSLTPAISTLTEKIDPRFGFSAVSCGCGGTDETLIPWQEAQGPFQDQNPERAKLGSCKSEEI